MDSGEGEAGADQEDQCESSVGSFHASSAPEQEEAQRDLHASVRGSGIDHGRGPRKLDADQADGNMGEEDVGDTGKNERCASQGDEKTG
jgi:hypothetical protein